jgi:uncharacterized protein (DUF2062 family)
MPDIPDTGGMELVVVVVCMLFLGTIGGVTASLMIRTLIRRHQYRKESPQRAKKVLTPMAEAA